MMEMIKLLALLLLVKLWQRVTLGITTNVET